MITRGVPWGWVFTRRVGSPCGVQAADDARCGSSRATFSRCAVVSRANSGSMVSAGLSTTLACITYCEALYG